MSRTLLRSALIVPVVARPYRGDVIVEDGIIAELRASTGSFDGDVVDCSERVLMPGLINAHLHPELHILKGIVEELDLHAWDEADHLRSAMDLLSSERGHDMQQIAVRASIADCALTGTTCIATYGVTTGADDVAAQELRSLGVRGHVTIRDVAFMAAATQPATRMKPPRMYRLHAEEALTHQELSAAAQAHARGERLVMHAAETEHRLGLVIRQFGTSTVRLLGRYGLLSERMLLSHAVHVDAEEIELLAVNNVPVVSSPTAEMKLADGVAPVVEMLKAGVTVALGTDCAICNNSDDMFLEMRQLGLCQKLRYGANAMGAEQILLSATLYGACALGHEGQLGAIAEGMAADLILVDIANARLQPLVMHSSFDNVAANLVYGATGQDVTDVMIGGEWVVRRRILQNADQQKIWRDLRDAATELYTMILP